jgi:hypothetical protein
MNQSNDMMNHADEWMNGWGGGGMWLWTGIGLLIIVLLVVLIGKRARE